MGSVLNLRWWVLVSICFVSLFAVNKISANPYDPARGSNIHAAIASPSLLLEGMGLRMLLLLAPIHWEWFLCAGKTPKISTASIAKCFSMMAEMYHKSLSTRRDTGWED